MWKPFEVQFSDLLKELKDNTTLLQLELTAATSEEAMKFYTTLQKRYLYGVAAETEESVGESQDSEPRKSTSGEPMVRTGDTDHHINALKYRHTP